MEKRSNTCLGCKLGCWQPARATALNLLTQLSSVMPPKKRLRIGRTGQGARSANVALPVRPTREYSYGGARPVAHRSHYSTGCRCWVTYSRAIGTAFL